MNKRSFRFLSHRWPAVVALLTLVTFLTSFNGPGMGHEFSSWRSVAAAAAAFSAG